MNCKYCDVVLWSIVLVVVSVIGAVAVTRIQTKLKV